MHQTASGKPKENKEDLIIDLKVVTPVFKYIQMTLSHESQTYLVEQSSIQERYMNYLENKYADCQQIQEYQDARIKRFIIEEEEKVEDDDA